MKICRICPSFPDNEEGTGVEIHLYNLTKEQIKLGVDISIVTAGNKQEQKIINGAKVYRIKRKSPFQLTSGFDLLKTAERLHTKENFDVLQIHNPLVLPFFPKKISKVPMVFSIHATLMDYKNLFSVKNLHKSVKGYLEYYMIAKPLCDHAAKITTGSSDEKRELVKYLGINPSKIVPILGKAKTKLFKPGVKTALKKELGISGPVVLSVGRLVKKKGYEYLVKAFRKVVDEFPDANLVLVGGRKDDEDYELIMNVVRNLRLENNFRFFLPVKKKELVDFYTICDVYVQPSISEGFPQTVEDAMSSGKPVIATAVYGPKDVIRNGYNGFLVPRRDSEALARRMLELLKDRQKMKRFGRNNRKLAVKELDWAITAKKHYEIYKEIV